MRIAARSILLAVARLFAAAAGLGAAAAAAQDALRLSSSHGRIDFAVGDSMFFKTSGTFKDWTGTLRIDERDIGASRVEVTVALASADTRDPAQNEQLRGPDFFDVGRFPTLVFRSTRVERTGERTLKIDGDVTLRGVTRPMTLDVTVNQPSRPGAPPWTFDARGRIKRSEFGMVRWLDVTGETVDIRIRADGLR